VQAPKCQGPAICISLQTLTVGAIRVGRSCIPGRGRHPKAGPQIRYFGMRNSLSEFENLSAGFGAGRMNWKALESELIEIGQREELHDGICRCCHEICFSLVLHKPQMRFAPTTSPRVRPAIRTSPRAPTMKGRSPCLDITRKFVPKPTPAKVSRNAHFERLPREAT
jgi:hypothetical protein